MKKQIKRVISTFLSLLMIVGIVNFSSLTAKAANVADIFDDVEAGKWYVNAIQFVYDRGLMVGTSSNTFGVHQKLQREQFAQILYSMAGKPFLTHGWENPFSDVPNEPGYPRDAIIWAYTNGIAVGNRNGTFGVGEAIQREAVSVPSFGHIRTVLLSGTETVHSASEKLFRERLFLLCFINMQLNLGLI